MQQWHIFRLFSPRSCSGFRFAAMYVAKSCLLEHSVEFSLKLEPRVAVAG